MLFTTYIANYPALPPLQNLEAQASSAAAPAITAGTLIADEHLLAAMLERRLREAHLMHGMATSNEVVAAVVREHAIMREHVMATYGPAVPAWSLAAVKAAFDQELAAMEQEMQELASRLDELEKTAAELAAPGSAA